MASADNTNAFARRLRALILDGPCSFGRDMALQVAREGHHACIVGTNERRLEECVRELRAINAEGEYDYHCFDVGDLDTVQSHMPALCDGRQFDVLLVETTPKVNQPNQTQRDRLLEVNAIGPYIVWRNLIARRAGGSELRLVFIVTKSAGVTFSLLPDSRQDDCGSWPTEARGFPVFYQGCGTAMMGEGRCFWMRQAIIAIAEHARRTFLLSGIVMQACSSTSPSSISLAKHVFESTILGKPLPAAGTWLTSCCAVPIGPSRAQVAAFMAYLDGIVDPIISPPPPDEAPPPPPGGAPPVQEERRPLL